MIPSNATGVPTTMKKSHIGRALLCACSLLVSVPAFAQNIAVKSGEKIAFLGDSITANGSSKPLGYVNLVMAGLAANGVKAQAFPAGISGQMSDAMLARVDRGIIMQKPQWMTLSCGVNDVWHTPGITLDAYKTNITSIVNKVSEAGIKVVIMTSTLIHEDPKDPLNEKAIPYNDFLRSLAKEKNLPLADLNADFRAAREALTPEEQKKNMFTVDGVHMNWAGDQIMATGVLRAFGLSPAEIKKASDYWVEMPVNMAPGLSMNQLNRLDEAAKKQNRPVNELVNEAVKKYLDSLPAAAH